MLTFITAKRAVLSSLTCAGLMATVLGIVNRGSGLRFHVPAPRVHINENILGAGPPLEHLVGDTIDLLHLLPSVCPI